jgi:hypothetical protein
VFDLIELQMQFIGMLLSGEDHKTLFHRTLLPYNQGYSVPKRAIETSHISQFHSII